MLGLTKNCYDIYNGALAGSVSYHPVVRFEPPMLNPQAINGPNTLSHQGKKSIITYNIKLFSGDKKITIFESGVQTLSDTYPLLK